MNLIKKFILAKIKVINPHGEIVGFKIRPVLIIKENKNYYIGLPLTSQLKYKNCKNRLDVYTNYNLNKHSQIMCDIEVLIAKNHNYKIIAECNDEDFVYIINRYNSLKEE